MGSANLNITISERRMLPAADAAKYCGMPAKYFKTDCPVQPLDVPKAGLLWDKRDLDRWIDGLKDGAEMTARDDILGRL